MKELFARMGMAGKTGMVKKMNIENMSMVQDGTEAQIFNANFDNDSFTDHYDEF